MTGVGFDNLCNHASPLFYGGDHLFQALPASISCGSCFLFHMPLYGGLLGRKAIRVLPVDSSTSPGCHTVAIQVSTVPGLHLRLLYMVRHRGFQPGYRQKAPVSVCLHVRYACACLQVLAGLYCFHRGTPGACMSVMPPQSLQATDTVHTGEEPGPLVRNQGSQPVQLPRQQKGQGKRTMTLSKPGCPSRMRPCPDPPGR